MLRRRDDVAKDLRRLTILWVAYQATVA